MTAETELMPLPSPAHPTHAIGPLWAAEQMQSYARANVAHATAAKDAEIEALRAEVEMLRGLRPEFPPYPPEGGGLPRYGLRWNGPEDPLSVPMDDGYWTPWHLAERLAEALRGKVVEWRQTASDPCFPDDGDPCSREVLDRENETLRKCANEIEALLREQEEVNG